MDLTISNFLNVLLKSQLDVIKILYNNIEEKLKKVRRDEIESCKHAIKKAKNQFKQFLSN